MFDRGESIGQKHDLLLQSLNTERTSYKVIAGNEIQNKKQIVFGIEALAFSPVQKQSAKNKHQRAINLPGLNTGKQYLHKY